MKRKLPMPAIESLLMEAKQQLKEFFEWWGQGLLLLLPGRWLARLRHQSDTVTVEQRDSALHFKRYNSPTRELHEERSVLLDDEIGKVTINSWLNRHENPPRLILLLPNDEYLQKPLAYPLSSEKELRAILEFEIDKQTPFAQDDAYFDYVITRTDTANGRLHIILYLVLRSVLDKYLADLSFLDLQPASATTSSGNNIANINFMPPPDTRLNGRSDRRLIHLALATFILFIASLYVPLLRHGAIVEQFEQQVEQSSAHAMQAQSLLDKKQAILERVEFLSNQTQRHISPLRIIQDLSRRLPDNTWINRLNIRAGEIQVHGESEAAAAVIQIMEESDYFEQAQFRSPVTKNNSTGKDQFHIAANLRLEGEQ